MTEKNELEGFPREVIDLMLERQVEQGHPRNENVFKKDKCTSKDDGGFDWHLTIERESFWHSVITNLNFAVFFEQYPKATIEEEPNTNVTYFFDGFKNKVIALIEEEVKTYNEAFNVSVKSDDFIACSVNFIAKMKCEQLLKLIKELN